MRLFKISLLIQYFKIAKNKKKALLFINIGIFLSIFALSSAFISLYIENKVNKFQFELLEQSYEIKTFVALQKQIPTLVGELDQANLIDKNFETKQNYLSLNSYTNRIISRQDMFLPSLLGSYDIQKEIDRLREFIILEFKSDEPETFDDTIALMMDNLFKKKNAKFYKEYLSTLKNKFKPFVTPEQNKKYYEIVYNINQGGLLVDTVEIKPGDFYSGEYNDQYELYENLKYNLKEFGGHFDTWLGALIFFFEQEITNINKEIVFYSNLENKIIGLVFLLQLIIFFIIQFFEISSLNQTTRKLRNSL